MKIVFVRQTVLPALLVLSPVVFAADEQTMIVSAAPQVVSELDTPAAVSVVDGEEMRLATPRINLSESLTGVPGLQVQNRQNYAQDCLRGINNRPPDNTGDEYELYPAIPAVCLRCPGTALR